MIIKLEGTSSAGKSSIMKEMPKSYNKISMDEIYDIDCGDALRICGNKKLKNKYYNEKEKNEYYIYCYNMQIISNIKKDKINIIDMVDSFDDKGFPNFNKLVNDKISVLVHTNLENLTKNILGRKLIEPRGLDVYEKFTDYHVVTNDKNYALDKINYNQFVKNLKNIKYLFDSELSLLNFADYIFKKLGVKKLAKNKDYYIKPKLQHDLVLITKNKTPKILSNEIVKFIKNIKKV